MELIFWWMPPLAIVAIAVAGAIVALVRRRRPRAESGRPVANTTRLTALPGYRAALGRYRLLLGAVAASALLLVVGSVGLASRPASSQLVYPEAGNRDIVLCLDVSGSMIDFDAEIVEVFGELASRFDGERISLVVFNASAVTYFPLTSDYDYIRQQLGRIGEQFDSDDADYFAGTFFGDGSSLIGDGLASCTERFDTPEADRSRSIILATDNLVVGAPVFTLAEAGALAARRGIRVYGVNPGDQSSREYLDVFADEFEAAVTDTGGAYYALADPGAIPSIVESISAEQAALVRGTPQLTQSDRPAVPLLLAYLGLAGAMVLAWRVRR